MERPEHRNVDALVGMLPIVLRSTKRREVVLRCGSGFALLRAEATKDLVMPSNHVFGGDHKRIEPVLDLRRRIPDDKRSTYRDWGRTGQQEDHRAREGTEDVHFTFLRRRRRLTPTFTRRAQTAAFQTGRMPHGRGRVERDVRPAWCLACALVSRTDASTQPWVLAYRTAQHAR